MWVCIAQRMVEGSSQVVTREGMLLDRDIMQTGSARTCSQTVPCRKKIDAQAESCLQHAHACLRMPALSDSATFNKHVICLSPCAATASIGVVKLRRVQVAFFVAAPLRWLKLGIEHRNGKQRLNDAY